jgi:hypothetical protein
MLPKSIRKKLAIRKIRHPLTYDKIFPDFRTVAHENDGIKGKQEKSVGVLSAGRGGGGASGTMLARRAYWQKTS